MHKRVLIYTATLLFALAGSAQATIIGVAVDGIATNNQVGSYNADGSLNFYALLSGSGTYGDLSGSGLSPDTCTVPGSCTGGTLDMWLRFAPVQSGSTLLSLYFNDLDLFGVNSPAFFRENVEIFDSSGVSLAFVDQATDPQVVQASTNGTNQLLELLVNIPNDPFFLRLSFKTGFVGAPPGTYTNTVETVLATVVSVPEPGTLFLFGIGLAGLAFSRRRKAANGV